MGLRPRLLSDAPLALESNSDPGTRPVGETGFAARNIGQLAFETLKRDLASADLVREIGVSHGKIPFVNDGTRHATRRSLGASGRVGATCAEFGFLSAARGFLGKRSDFLSPEFGLRMKT
jgi:sirohydrochlorin ferrochelatase